METGVKKFQQSPKTTVFSFHDTGMGLLLGLFGKLVHILPEPKCSLCRQISSSSFIDALMGDLGGAGLLYECCWLQS